MRDKYEVKAYDYDGNFKGIIKSAALEGFSARINGGLEDLELKFSKDDWEREDFDQIKINRVTDYHPDKNIYHGLNNVNEGVEMRKGSVNGTAKCFGYFSEMNTELFEKSLKMKKFSLSDTVSGAIKQVLMSYFALKSSVCVEYTDENTPTNLTFGGLRQRAQMFLTPDDEEECLVTRVDCQMKYVGGIAGAIYWKICEDNAGVPGATVGSANTMTTLSSTAYDWLKCIATGNYTTKGIQLDPSTYYHIVWYSPASSSTSTYHINSDAAGTYGDGYVCTSNDGGTIWASAPAYDILFKVYYKKEDKVNCDWDDNTIDNITNSISVPFNAHTHKQALDMIMKYTPAGYYYYWGTDGKFYLRKAGLSQSFQIDACDSATFWTGATVTTEYGVKEGSGALLLECDSSETYWTYALGGVLDLSDYECIGPSWIYLGQEEYNELFVIQIDIGQYPFDWFDESLIITRQELHPGWNYVLPLCNFQNKSIKSIITDISIVYYTQSGTPIFGSGDIVVDDLRAANLKHHDVDFDTEVEFKAFRDLSNVKNYAVVTNAQSGGSKITTVASNDLSIENNGRRMVYERNDKLDDTPTAQARAQQIVNSQGEARSRCSPLKVQRPYPIENILPGHTITIKNVPEDLRKYLVDRMVISGINYKGDEVELELIERLDDPSSELARYKEEVDSQISDDPNANYQT